MSSNTNRPTPAVGDVITTEAELDALPEGSVVLNAEGVSAQKGGLGWFLSAITQCERPLKARALVQNLGPAFTVLHRPDAPAAARSAGVDREVLQAVIAPLVAPYASGPLDPLDVEIADAVLAFLAAQPTPAPDGHVCTIHCDQGSGHYPTPEDADAVERAARALYAEEQNESMSGDQWPEFNSPENVGRAIYLDHARAALAAARAGGGGVTVTAEQVRDHIDAYEELAGQCVSVEHLRALGVEVQR